MPDDLAQVHAVDQGHGEIGNAREDTRFEKRDDARVIEPGNKARFALETLHGNGVGDHGADEELERHGLAGSEVVGSIDDAHASPAERFSKPVGAEFATGQRQRRGDAGRQPRLVLEELLQLRNQVRMAVQPGRLVEVLAGVEGLLPLRDGLIDPRLAVVGWISRHRSGRSPVRGYARAGRPAHDG